MKVILPSNGLLGTRWVDMRQPIFEDLRNALSATADEYLFKYEFIKNMCDFDDTKITMDDVQFLYEVAAFSVCFNTIDFRIKCNECDTIVDGVFSYATDDVPIHTLHKESRKCKKVIDDIEYNFHILSAKDGVDIYTYAMVEDEDESARRVEDGTACKVLGYDITDENIEKIKKLPVSIYIACFLFIKANKHGMILSKKVTCPKCGHESIARFELDSSWVKIDLPTFIAQYAQVRDCLDFKSFLKFTIPEYKNFVEYLNAEAKKNNNEWK